MNEELGFPPRKRGEFGKAGQSARAPKRADDPSRGVGREAVDIAQYVTDMTAQLEAMAVAARLDLLAYFLGMAKAESELFVRTHAVAEVERDFEAEAEVESPYVAAAEMSP